VLGIESACGMIARFDGIEQVAAGSMAAAAKPHCTVNV
jgi:hypothetical protein